MRLRSRRIADFSKSVAYVALYDFRLVLLCYLDNKICSVEALLFDAIDRNSLKSFHNVWLNVLPN